MRARQGYDNTRSGFDNTRWFILLLPIILLTVATIAEIDALVVTAPKWGQAGTLATAPAVVNEHDEQKQNRALNLKIRSTTPQDINSVGHILAHALVMEDHHAQHHNHHLEQQRPQQNPFFARPSVLSSQSPHHMNFKKKMRFLRTRSGIVAALLSRMDAIGSGEKAFRRESIGGTKCCSTRVISRQDMVKVLWSNDDFRRKVERASKMSTEPHVWGEHNFACAPTTPEWFCHKMVTAENALTGEVVGFCEIAMLSPPASRRDEDDGPETQQLVPTIINLATFTPYRRRGVASRIVASASRYIQQEWAGEELALYVESGNTRAIQTYEALGFQRKSKTESDGSDYHWYMSLPLIRCPAAICSFSSLQHSNESTSSSPSHTR